MLSSSFPLFSQQHCNPRWQTQQDTSDLGEGNSRPWEQRHGSCQVPLQPSCQGHWTQNPGGKRIFTRRYLFAVLGCLSIPHSMRENLNYRFVLLRLCIQHGSLSAPFGARRALWLASCAEGVCLIVKGFVCLLSLERLFEFWDSSSAPF